jgi:hypothetical protein
MVQYYRDMWAKHSEMLAPLTNLVGEVFDDVKAAIVKEVVLAYPDFTKPFGIYTDASTMQLG